MDREEGVHVANETLQTIARRRSVRLFEDRPVDARLVKTLLDAANQAPSAHNQQSWRFLVIGEQKKKALVDLISSRSADFPRPAAVLLRMAARTITTAPLVIAVANTGEMIRHGTIMFGAGAGSEDFFRIMEIQSSAAAVENLLLAATSCNLGSVWLGVLYLIKDEVLGLLGEPQGEFMAVVPIGYGKVPTKNPKKRPAQETVTYLD